MISLRLIAISVVLLATLALMWGCGDDRLVLPSSAASWGEIFYVDSSYVGHEYGSEEHPYNTIEEGIAAAARGDTVVLAPGPYGSGVDVAVPNVITILGAGAGVSVLSGRIMIEAAPDTLSVIVKRLTCDSVNFRDYYSRSDRSGDVVDTPPEGARVQYAPILVDSCSVSSAGTGFPRDHSYTIQNSTVTGSVRFDHNSSHVAFNIVRACAIADSVYFIFCGGGTENTVEDCTIGGRVILCSASGASHSIRRNTCYGIEDASDGGYVAIMHNMLPTGNIVDRSDGVSEYEEEFIEYNVLDDGYIKLACFSATVRNNTVTTTADTFGIDAVSGSPTNIIGNVVTVPYAVPRGESGTAGSVGIRLACNYGIVMGNTVTGGAYGILDESATALVSDNKISGSHHGIAIYASYYRADYLDNTVTDCVADGVVVAGLPGRFAGNTVTNNGGAGIRLLETMDLGGGAEGSIGGNTITGNAGYDLYVEVPFDSAPVIYAEGNIWDHSTEGEIDADDIYDVNDDPSLGDVDFMPLAD